MPVVECKTVVYQGDGPMGLNIKNEEAHRLATELAQLTGESLTEAVTTALRERLERVASAAENDKEQLRKDILKILDRVQSEIRNPIPDHGDFLYDERGLPK